MQTFHAKVFIKLKGGILDPQGKAVAHALASLGFEDIDEVRVGKMIELTLARADAQSAQTAVQQACEKLLANPVIEDFEIDIHPRNGQTK